MEGEKRLESVEGLFSGPLSLARAAHLLRMPIGAVQEALHAGELPATESNGELHVDGPALLADFRSPVESARRQP